jgi:hypothetical protein
MNSTLADFDNHLMNGLDFCKKAYGLFEQIRRNSNGVERLRLRKGKLEKKLVEELLPIARYIQARYSHGRQMKVRWKDGTQNYDARLLSTGALVDVRLSPKSQYVEVTTAIHENDHIARSISNKNGHVGHVFGVKGIQKDPQTVRKMGTLVLKQLEIGWPFLKKRQIWKNNLKCFRTYVPSIHCLS